MKVLITGGGTGGHLVPALTIADALASARDDLEIVYVGATRGIESRIMPERVPAYPFHLVHADPVYRRQWWKNVRWLVTGPRLWRECRRILKREQPRVIVATGGYVSAGIGYTGARSGVPLVLQEQNAYPGLATRWLAGSAREIYLGYPEAERLLKPGSGTEVHHTGNPIAPPNTDRHVARRELGIADDARVCLIMGGSQGAVAINGFVTDAVANGALDGITVLWATGHRNHDDLVHLHRPPEMQLRPYWDPIGTAYAAADLVVGRAGAMSTAEYSAWGLPSILIPLPTSAADHQAENARAMDAAGASVLLPQSEASAEKLAGIVRELLGDSQRLDAMARAARKRAKPDATDRITERILHLLK